MKFLKVLQILLSVVCALVAIAYTSPQVIVHGIDVSDHPRLCIEFQVIDTSTIPHTYYSNLDSSHFNVWQKHSSDVNNIVSPIYEQYPIDSRRVGYGNNVMLTINGASAAWDPSWSSIRPSFLNYIHTMDSYDKTGILTYGYADPMLTNAPEFVDTLTDLTNNENILDSIITHADSIMGVGYQNMLDGLFYSYKMLKHEKGPKAVIALTSVENVGFYNTHSFRELIDTATAYNIATYMVSTSGSLINRQRLQPRDLLEIDSIKILIDSVGGGVFDVSNNLQFQMDSTLQEIRNQLNAEYSVCYMSPDTVVNGDTNNVALQVTMSAFTPYIDSSFWIENNQSPVITLTDSTNQLFNRNLSPLNSITITAEIIDNGNITDVLFYYRTTGMVNYRKTNMHLFSGDTFRVIIPSDSIASPGLDFYVVAIDDFRLKGKSPLKHYPQMYPHHFSIGNDPSALTSSVNNCYNPVDNEAQVRGETYDTESAEKVVLHYKPFGNAYFENDTLLVQSDSSFTSIISFNQNAPYFEYYFHVLDAVGAITRFPVTGELSDVGCITQSSSSSGPALSSSSSISSSQSVISSVTLSSSSTYPSSSSAVSSSSSVTLWSSSVFLSSSSAVSSSSSITLWSSSVFLSSHSAVWSSSSETVSSSSVFPSSYSEVPSSSSVIQSSGSVSSSSNSVVQSSSNDERSTSYIPLSSIEISSSSDQANPEPMISSSSVSVIGDTIPPILLTVIKNPYNPSHVSEFIGVEITPDTLLFTFSEPVVVSDGVTSFTHQFIYSAPCEASHNDPLYGSSVERPSANPSQWELYVFDNIPEINGCIIVDTSVSVIRDLAGNELSYGVVVLSGANRTYPVILTPINSIADGTPYNLSERIGDVTGTAIAIDSKERSFKVMANIFDGLGNYVTSLSMNGGGVPASNEEAARDYLYWDLTDENNETVGTGVYIWKIIIDFGHGSNEKFLVRTGVIR